MSLLGTGQSIGANGLRVGLSTRCSVTNGFKWLCLQSTGSLRITEDFLLASTFTMVSESLAFHWLKKHCLTSFQAVIRTYSNSTLRIYQVDIYSKQAYICDFTIVSTSGFTRVLLPGCNLTHWRQWRERSRSYKWGYVNYCYHFRFD